MIAILAQAASQHGDPQGPTWMWIVTAICLPLIMIGLGGILYRQRNSDEKLETQGKEIVRISTTVGSMKGDVEKVVEKIDSVNEKTLQLSGESAATTAEIMQMVERDFVRKSEFREAIKQLQETIMQAMEQGRNR